MYSVVKFHRWQGLTQMESLSMLYKYFVKREEKMIPSKEKKSNNHFFIFNLYRCIVHIEGTT